MKKDDVIEVKIEDMGVDGEGIGKADGITLFIKDAVIGDVVQAKIMKMKKSYGYARLLEVLTPSPYRVEPKCPVSRPCGGCQLITDNAVDASFRRFPMTNSWNSRKTKCATT